MKYNPKELVVKPSPKPGTTMNAKVTKVEEGSVDDFVSGEGLQSWKDPDQDCINVTAQAEDGSKRSILLTLPSDNQVPEKSKLGKWQNRYGKFPEEGDAVTFVANKDGFWDFNL